MSMPSERPPVVITRRWRTSVASGAWGVAGVIVILLGVLTQRTDVAMLGVPLVITLVWNWLRRPPDSDTGEAVLRGADQMSEPGEVSADLDLNPARGAANMHLRIAAPGHRSRQVAVDVRSPRTLRLAMNTVRTGRHRVFGTDLLEAGPDYTVRQPPLDLEPISIMVLPAAKPLKETPLPFRLQGLTGAHNSRRAGDGGDLHDVNLFAPGDRLRRIDWRVTARRAGTGGPGQHRQLTDLYVRRTFATADATVMLVLDSRDEVGPDISNWSGAQEIRQDQATSLDIAREAAASLARRYLDGGDRVGLEDLGKMKRPVPPAGGRQQLRRLTHHLALAQPEGEPKPRKRAPRLPSGALIIVFSTFLDDDVMQLTRLWRHAGHRVMAVDVLPELEPAPLPPRLHTAFRIIRMERGDRLRELATAGVEVIHWEGDPDGNGSDATVDVALTALSRKRGDRR